MGVTRCVMRYRTLDILAAISGDIDEDGNPHGAGEAPDTDWVPTVPDFSTVDPQNKLNTLPFCSGNPTVDGTPIITQNDNCFAQIIIKDS